VSNAQVNTYVPNSTLLERYAILMIFFLLAGLSHRTPAQELRRTMFSSLNVSPVARVTGLGGVNVSLADRDPGLFLSNPALVSDSLTGFASLNYQFHVADIGHASFTYLPKFRRMGQVALGVEHFSYGTLDGYDPSGNPTEKFSVSETAITISKSHQIGNFRLGASLKTAFSSIAGFRSSALLFDIGGVFIHPKKNVQVGLVLKNAGVVISDYTGSNDSKLPIDLQLGASIKPEHMPVRFSITTYRLIQSSAVSYDNATRTSPTTLQRVFRHFNFGLEVLLHRNVNLLAGYNYGIRQELKLEDAGGSAGFSFGFSARIKRLEFVFSRNTYVAGTAGYSFTLSTNLNKMFRHWAGQ
jgi:hypothetical protein